MLVLSRRENDQIDFPTLGISVEVMRLTRSRAALGIVAPKNIRVVRHELLAESGYLFSEGGLPAAIQNHLAARMENQIEAATDRIKLAQADLMAGKTEEALAALGQALAELDSLKANAGQEQSPLPNHTAAWPVAGSVAESTVTYSRSSNQGSASSNQGSAATNGKVVCLSVAESDRWASELTGHGFDVLPADDALAVFYQLSCHQKPDAVLIMAAETDPIGEATVRIVQNCSQHRDVPIVFAAADSSGDEQTPGLSIDPSAIAEQLRSAIDRRVVMQ